MSNEFEYIESVIKDAETLKNYKKIFKEQTEVEVCDDKFLGFNETDYKNASVVIDVKFHSWAQFNGNPNKKKILDFNNKEKIKNLFISYLNENINDIMQYIAKNFQAEALMEKVALKQALQQKINYLDSIEEENTK